MPTKSLNFDPISPLRAKNSCDSIRRDVDWRNNCESYLAGRDELQGPKGGLQVLCVALEVEESASDGGLQLGGVLPGGRVEGNLVDGSHDCERRGGSAGCRCRRRGGVLSSSDGNLLWDRRLRLGRACARLGLVWFVAD